MGIILKPTTIKHSVYLLVPKDLPNWWKLIEIQNLLLILEKTGKINLRVFISIN